MSSGPGLLLSTWVGQPTSALVEWLGWHRILGARDIVVFIDRRAARAHPLLTALASANVLRLVPVTVDPDIREEGRNAALRAGALEGAARGGYGLFLGPDEYLRLHGRAQGIAGLMRGAGGADVMSLPVCEAGTGGFDRHAPGPVLQLPRPVAPPGGALRSVVRLGLFAARTPEGPAGPPARDTAVRWVDGSGAELPEPHSRVGWARSGQGLAMACASVLRIAAPTSETFLLRGQHLPEKQRPATEAMLARLADLAAIDGPMHGIGTRAPALAAQIAELMARPGVAEAQAALCKQECETLAGLLPEVPPAAAPAPAAQVGDVAEDASQTLQALPGWFAEIHTAGGREGFYTRLENHAVTCIRRDPARLVVTFDNLSNVNDLSPAREPWAYRFVRENGCSHLSVMARRKDWYRCPQLIAHLEKLKDDGLFAEFAQVWLTGTSMGGFAALAFASLAPGATVIAFNPQTTLDATLVPWEDRFGMGRARDWSLPHSDAAFEIDDAAQVFVLYDPFFAPDRRQVARLEGENVTRLKTWCSGHFSPVFLHRANLLKPVMQHALDGTLTPAVFYRLYRERRTLPWYRKALQSNLQERGHDSLARRVSPAFRRLRREAAE